MNCVCLRLPVQQWPQLTYNLLHHLTCHPVLTHPSSYRVSAEQRFSLPLPLLLSCTLIDSSLNYEVHCDWATRIKDSAKWFTAFTAIACSTVYSIRSCVSTKWLLGYICGVGEREREEWKVWQLLHSNAIASVTWHRAREKHSKRERWRGVTISSASTIDSTLSCEEWKIVCTRERERRRERGHLDAECTSPSIASGNYNGDFVLSLL